MNLQEAINILDICKEDHQEFIGNFYKNCKIHLDGHFVIDELEAIIVFMKYIGGKQSH